DCLAMTRPIVGGGLQAMVDVHGTQRWRVMGTAVVGQQVQQDGGVETAGEGDAPGRGIEPGREGSGKVDHEGLARERGSPITLPLGAASPLAGKPAPTGASGVQTSSAWQKRLWALGVHTSSAG